MLEITLLGYMRARQDGTPLGGLNRGKRAALLAYLAVEHDQDHSREALASLLWPEAAPDTARSNLRQQLFHLRKGLGEHGDLIHAGRQYVRLSLDPEQIWVDLHELKDTAPRCTAEPGPEECRDCLGRMARRTGLYQGPLLQELPLETDNEAFNDWLQPHRESARRQTLTLLERLSHCHEAMGTPDRALTAVQRYLATEPLDEGGHRLAMRLLAAEGHSDAVAAQYGQCRTVLERELGVAPTPETEALARELAEERNGAATPEPSFAANGERRQVTALHGELSLPGEADPEALLERLQPLMQAMRRQVEAQGGVVERQYGTGLLAYFGFPATREGVAVDAVQTAFNIRQELQTEAPDVHAGFGVHTGTVIAEGGSADPTGMLSRQAARLHEQLPPGEIGVSATTRELVRGFFRIAGEPTLGDPAAYRVLAVGGADNRLMPRDRDNLAPMQDRTRELAFLRERWDRACQGAGTVIHINGEAGVGKSRLLHELVSSPGDTPMLVRHYRCQRQGQDTPLHPLRAVLSELIGLHPEEDDDAQRRRLREFFAERPAAPAEGPALFAELLGLPWPGGPPEMTATEKRRRLFDSLTEIIVQRARQRPTVLILEDVHWADSATLGLAEQIAQRAAELPLLFLCTSRPLNEPDCVARLGVETLPLTPLPPRDTDALIRAHATTTLDDEMVRALRRQSDGIPLFAEELARAVTGVGEESARLDRVPASLEDLLHERLDRLGEHKRLAQLAATVGREVDPTLLATVTGQEQGQLEAQLAVLCEQGLLQRLETVTGPSYQFRHALIRQAAYQSQVRPDRRGAHGRIANGLLREHPKRVQIYPEEVAHHLSEAERNGEAVGHWLTAAQQAFDQWAVREADELALHGLNAHDQAAGAATPTAERQLLLIRAKARAHLEGYGAERADQLFRRALALAPEDASAPGDRFAALYGRYMGSSAHDGHPQALELGHSLQSSAAKIGDDTLGRVSDIAVGSTSFWLADYPTAETHLRRACAWDEPERWAALASTEAARDRIRDFSRDPVVDALIYLGVTWWDTGYPTKGIAATDRAVDLGHRVGHAYTLGAALAFRGSLWHFAGDVRATEQVVAELEELSTEHELPVHGKGFAQIMRAWIQARLGHLQRLDELQGALGTLQHGVGGIEPVSRVWLAEIFRSLNREKEGMEQVEAGLAAAERLGERRSLPELYRLRGELRALRDPADLESAMAELRHGLGLAEDNGSATHALRCGNALARLYLMRGEVGAARRLLTPYWQAMPEAADLLDWQAARRLLGLGRMETTPPDSP